MPSWCLAPLSRRSCSCCGATSIYTGNFKHGLCWSCLATARVCKRCGQFRAEREFNDKDAPWRCDACTAALAA